MIQEAQLLEGIRRARPVVKNILRRRPEDVEDILQEAALRALEKDNFEGRSRFSTWFIKIAMNQALMLLRHRQLDSTEEILELPAARSFSPESMAADRELLRKGFEMFPHRMSAIVTMRYEYGYSSKEVAAALGVGLDNTKSYCHRARKKLKELIRRRENERIHRRRVSRVSGLG